MRHKALAQRDGPHAFQPSLYTNMRHKVSCWDLVTNLSNLKVTNHSPERTLRLPPIWSCVVPQTAQRVRDSSIPNRAATVATLLFYFKNMVHPSAIVIKRCTRFSKQVRIQILHLSLMHHIFTLCFYQLWYLHFLFHQDMLWILFSSFSYVTFLNSICEITYVPRRFRTGDAGWFAVNWLQHFTTVPRKTMNMHCYLYIYV